MKTLYVVRHAKSSWDEPDQADFDRSLNERGKRDAPRMGKRLKEKRVHPDVIITSPAKRAKSTARRIAKVLEYPKEKIKTDDLLYHATDDQILAVLQKMNDKHDTVMYFGHNPGLTDFVNSIMNIERDIDNVPTCGVIAFQFSIDSWKQLTWGIGNLLFFDYPKSRED